MFLTAIYCFGTTSRKSNWTALSREKRDSSKYLAVFASIGRDRRQHLKQGHFRVDSGDCSPTITYIEQKKVTTDGFSNSCGIIQGHRSDIKLGAGSTHESSLSKIHTLFSSLVCLSGFKPP